MEEREQVEGMARVLCAHYTSDCRRCPDCFARDEAKALYSAGYCQPIESEWIVKRETDTDFYTARAVAHCNNCGEPMWYKSIVFLKKYCPECGARMKNATKRSKQ